MTQPQEPESLPSEHARYATRCHDQAIEVVRSMVEAEHYAEAALWQAKAEAFAQCALAASRPEPVEPAQPRGEPPQCQHVWVDSRGGFRCLNCGQRPKPAHKFDPDRDCPACNGQLNGSEEAFCAACMATGKGAVYMRGCEAAEREHLAELGDLQDRLKTIIDEAFGMQPPVEEFDDLLTVLEKELHGRRMSDAAADNATSKRIAELEALVAERTKQRDDAAYSDSQGAKACEEQHEALRVIAERLRVAFHDSRAYGVPEAKRDKLATRIRGLEAGCEHRFDSDGDCMYCEMKDPRR